MRKGESTLERRQAGLRWAILGLMLLVLGIWIFNAWPHRQNPPVRAAQGTASSSVYLKLPPVSAARTPSTAASESSVAVGGTAATTSSQPAVAGSKTQPASPLRSSATKTTTVPSPATVPMQAPAPEHTAKTAASKKTSVALPGTTCSVAGWYAQQGAFGRLSQATDLSNRLRQGNFSVCIGNLPANALYRVLVGPLPNRQAAAAVAARIHQDKLTRDMGYPQYWSPPQ